jgi:hypothetical protein
MLCEIHGISVGKVRSLVRAAGTVLSEPNGDYVQEAPPCAAEFRGKPANGADRGLAGPQASRTEALIKSAL